MAKKTKTFEVWATKLGGVMVLLREMKGIAMREHARQLECSPATLSRIERGYGCDVATLLHLHEKTGISLQTLMGLSAGKTEVQK